LQAWETLPQLLGQLQQADLGFDDFLFRRHSELSILRRRL
jgi:hypothetical protein